MSLYCEMVTIMKNQEALLDALSEVGFTREKVEVHSEPQTLYGYQGDPRPEKAEIIIRRNFVGLAANDIGFAKQKDGSYKAIISEYDRRNGYGDEWLNKLTQQYSVQTSRQWAKKHKYTVRTQPLPSGGIQVTMESY